MWSLGVMVMEMIEKDPPYMGMPPTRVLFNILKKGLPDLKVFFFLFFFFLFLSLSSPSPSFSESRCLLSRPERFYYPMHTEGTTR